MDDTVFPGFKTVHWILEFTHTHKQNKTLKVKVTVSSQMVSLMF
jgi:hypothetical protein